MGKENPGFIPPWILGQTRSGNEGGLGDAAHRRTFLPRMYEWEGARVEQIQKGMSKPYLIVDDLSEYLEIRSYDTLTGKNKIGDIRCDPDGHLRIPIRYYPEIVEEGGKRRLYNPRNINFTIVLPKGTPAEVLNDLPEKRGVAQLIFHRLDNIYDAMGQQRDIVRAILEEKPKRGEIQHAREVIEFTEEEMLGLTQRGTISRADAKKLATRTAQFILGLGVLGPREEKKLRSLNKLVDVVTTGKRVGRGEKKVPPNFLITLAKLGAAHTAATDRLAKLGFHFEKFSGYYQVLFLENQGSLWILRRADGQLERITTRHYAFIRPGANVGPIQKVGMTRAVMQIADRTDGQLRVRPFVVLSRWLKGILVEGLTESDLEATSEILEVGEEEARKVIARAPVIDLIDQGNFRDVKRRINTARRGIRRSIARYEKEEAPIFI